MMTDTFAWKIRLFRKIILITAVLCSVALLSLSSSSVRQYFEIRLAKPPLGEYLCAGYDSAGNKLIEGNFVINQMEETPDWETNRGQSIRGSWKMRVWDMENGKAGKTSEIQQGRLLGQISDGGVFRINLNPDISDSNDYLEGKLEGGSITKGAYIFCGFADCATLGTFETKRRTLF